MIQRPYDPQGQSLAIKNLREILAQTQAEFAAMIGASKDTVVSWEVGRNHLSVASARRISFATGVDAECLLSGISVPMCDDLLGDPKAYRIEDFERYRKTVRGRSDTEGARHHLRHCEDALELLFMAATKSEGEKSGNKLPAVLDSFIQWCDQTREEFKLGQLIDEELEKRRFKAGMTQFYRDWRAMMRGDPAVLRAAGFKDDPRKADGDELRLELELAPQWAPGRSMRGPKPAGMRAVLPKGEAGRGAEGRRTSK